MSDELKHIKVIVPELQDDGTVMYTTDSYYEKLAQNMVELERTIPTSRNTLLKDLIGCLDSKTRILLDIRYKYGEPVEIKKRWLISKESFSRK